MQANYELKVLLGDDQAFGDVLTGSVSGPPGSGGRARYGDHPRDNLRG